jgi:hypothetical protein
MKIAKMMKTMPISALFQNLIEGIFRKYTIETLFS